MAAHESEHPVIPIPLQHEDLNAPPDGIVARIDYGLKRFKTSDEWRAKVDRAVGQTAMVGDAVFAAFTKRRIREFLPASKAPTSLPIALDDYARFRLDRRTSLIVLLVDEAQNLRDSDDVVNNLSTLHGGINGDTKVLLVCFGLANTVERLRQLGLSRLDERCVKTIGTLSEDEARQTVTGTLEKAFADVAFAESDRQRWIGTAAGTILAESADFPHHLANGCRALASIVLNEGIGDEPPVEALRDECRDQKRRYYDSRLHPWRNHTTALAHAFAAANEGWTPIGNITAVLAAADDFGVPVGRDAATAVVKELCANGFVEKSMSKFRPAIPSLSAHFAAIRAEAPSRDDVVKTIRAAMADAGVRDPQGR